MSRHKYKFTWDDSSKYVVPNSQVRMENYNASSPESGRELAGNLEQTPLRREPFQRRRPYCPQIGRNMSKGAVLVIVWTYLFIASFVSDRELPGGSRVPSAIVLGITVLLSPFAGLTASVYFSRYKVLLSGLW